jgi:two-component system sensor histidine kinase KdpD
VPIDELLDDRVRRLGHLLRDTKVLVNAPSGLPLVSADYTMVEQVVTNLLDNARRHTPPGGRVLVGAEAHGDFVAVSVTDEGPGVDPADAERLFRPFERGDDSRSVGLGLAICRAIVEAHGGEIAVEPADGGDGVAAATGARFTFTLPVHHG